MVEIKKTSKNPKDRAILFSLFFQKSAKYNPTEPEKIVNTIYKTTGYVYGFSIYAIET